MEDLNKAASEGSAAYTRQWREMARNGLERLTGTEGAASGARYRIIQPEEYKVYQESVAEGGDDE
jgi:hypothetical protein